MPRWMTTPRRRRLSALSYERTRSSASSSNSTSVSRISRNLPWPVTRKPGNSRSRNRPSRSSSITNRIGSPIAPGSRMNRPTWLGSGSRARMPWPSSWRSSSRAITRPMLGMNGNGCAGSTASGVSTGNTRSMNQASSQVTSSADSDSGSHTSTPASCSRPRNSRQTRCCSASNASARSLISASCCAGVRPSGETAVRPGLRLTDQAGDAHRVELVEVGRADRDEAQALQQGMAGVLGLLDDAVVEIEPG